MPVLQGILKESLDYYRDLDRRLRARLRELPRGSLLKRRLGRQHYYYLVFRDGRRVVSKYLGKAEPAQVARAIEERRLVKAQLKEVLQNLRLLARVGRRRRRGRRLPKPA